MTSQETETATMENVEGDVEEGKQGTEDLDKPPLPSLDSHNQKAGGWKAIKFILANETFEKLASMSLIANITLYLHTKYNMDGILLVNIVSIWSGSSGILTLAGALLSDAYLGRFYTLLIGSIASLVGMGLMALSAAIRQLRPPTCTTKLDCAQSTGWQLAFLLIALALLAIGSGCIRPCNIAFGADQLDARTAKGRAQLARFYNWWYFSFTVALLVALTGVVYIQTNISWVIGFIIPTICFVFSIVIFLLGCHTYIYNKPQGSVFIDMVKVMVAAYHKRGSNLDQPGHQNFYDPPALDDPQLVVSKLSRTHRLKFLDKAALINDPSEINSRGTPSNSWKLCSVQQVEQLKCVVGILPVWVSGILSFVAMDQTNTFGILQALQMNRKVGSHFIIPPAWIGMTSMIALSLWVLTYERCIIPIMRKQKKRDDVRLSLKGRIRIGIIMSILCMTVAAITERKRREFAVTNNSFESPLSVGLLAPQLVLSGLVEAFVAVSIMEFFTTQMPESMRSIAGSIFFISLSMASYTSSVVVNIIYSITKKNGNAWLGGQDLNKNRLDYFYAIIGIIGVVNLFYFTFFSSKYIFVSNGDKASLNRDLSNYSSNRA